MEKMKNHFTPMQGNDKTIKKVPLLTTGVKQNANIAISSPGRISPRHWRSRDLKPEPARRVRKMKGQ
ncbi:hypothetical protein [Sulfurimicrobium lacus]|uniref:hypothetical protein n=1 Tax=Sulfurimicrobium lacus TaxID=2715678 RepID=UPI00156584D0|nr:hypothetical protein [Sulfurimicrobium lacus]